MFGFSSRSIALGVVLVLTVSSVALADPGTVRKGIDAWSTVPGQSHTSFADNPIPAGFFCDQSKPFTGSIALKGVPLATRPAKAMGPVDTVVSRLDDAVFNDQGVATTRIRLTALSLASVKPIQTECGAYDVKVSLTGEQPTTTMRIVRTEEYGGRYEAPLALNVRVVFTPVQGNRNREVSLVHRIDLGPGTSSVWTYAAKPRYDGPMWIDSNGDGKPDLQVRGDSNFLAGVTPIPTARLASWTAKASASTVPTCPPGTCLYQSCHCNPNEDSWDPYEKKDGCADDHLHCVWVCVNPNTAPSGTMMMCLDVAEPMDPSLQ
ncbi:MAG TPA: hypothetical protein VH394_12610 [Thermoanaerobaculia bacterium]|jgi:hypothetical protein|nr:hypothetical protein [Thermoanaerobaculia bacterium]